MVASTDSTQTRPSEPLVYVVTVCRNALADLQMTVDSVRAQRYARIAHVVQDGLSSDGTAAFLQANPGIVSRWVSEPDKGIYDAMNKAVSGCPDDAWLIFLNAGDRFASDDVLTRLAPLLTAEVDFVFGDIVIRQLDGSEKLYPARRGARMDMPGCHQSTLVRAALLKSQRFDTGYRVGADFEFFLRATRLARRVAFFDGPVGNIAPEGFSASNEDLLRRDYTAALAQHRGRTLATVWLMRRRARALALRWLKRAPTRLQNRP